MNIDDRIYLRRVPLMVIGVFALGLAACDPKSPTEQASKDPGRIVEQSSSPAAGKKVDPAKSAMDKDNTAKSGTTVDDLALSIKVEDALKSNSTLKCLPITVSVACQSISCHKTGLS